MRDREEVRSPSFEFNSRSHPENTQSRHTSHEDSDTENSSPEESTNEVPYTIDGDYVSIQFQLNRLIPVHLKSIPCSEQLVSSKKNN